MQLKSAFGVAVLATAAICPCLNSYAEEAVVVTATRFPESRLEHPVGVTVITREQIANSTASTLPELLTRYAGINMRNNTGSPDVAIDMRGFGVTGDQNTLVLLDGQRLNENELLTVRWSAIPLDAIERVEVQRGGGAVLYGGGASGGTINIITRSPIAGSKSADVAASYGTYNTSGLRAGLNLAGANTGFAIDVSQNSSDNYRANNRLEQGNLIGDLRWAGDRAGLVLKFGLDNQSLRLPGVRSKLQLETDPRGASTPNDYSSRDGKNATLSGRYAFDAFELAADLSYRDTKRNAFFDNYFGPCCQPSFLDTRTKIWAFTPRLKAPFKLFGRDDTLIAGADLAYWDYLSLRATDIAALATPGSNIAATQRDRALYAQNHTALTDSTKLTLGVRSQQVEIGINDRANPVASIASGAQSRSPRSWEAALRHNLTAAAAIYGKIGSSFRVATLDENFSDVSICPFFDPIAFVCRSMVTMLEPQTSRDKELGFEYRQRDWRLRASWYRMDLRNEIYFSALTFTNMNLSPTRREGVELEGNWKLNSRLDLFGSYTHASAVFREGVYGGVDVSGKSVPLVPRNVAKLGLTWLPLEKTRFSVALGYVGRQFYDNDQTNTFAGGQMPSYLIADLKLSRAIGAWNIALVANNLLDKRYYTYAASSLAPGSTNFNAYPMAGRTFLLTAAYRFR